MPNVDSRTRPAHVCTRSGSDGTLRRRRRSAAQTSAPPSTAQRCAPRLEFDVWTSPHRAEARGLAPIAARAHLDVGGLFSGGIARRSRMRIARTGFDTALISAMALFWPSAGRLPKRVGKAARPSAKAEATSVAWRTRRTLLVAILAVAALARFWALDFGMPHPADRPDESRLRYGRGYLNGSLVQTVFTYPRSSAGGRRRDWLTCRKARNLSPASTFSRPRRTEPAAVRWCPRDQRHAGVPSVGVLSDRQRLFDSLKNRRRSVPRCRVLHVRDSHFGVTDIPMTFMVLVAFHAIVQLAESGSTRHLLTASLLTGLAVATKYNAALLALPAGLAILDDPLGRPVGDRVVRALGLRRDDRAVR